MKYALLLLLLPAPALAQWAPSPRAFTYDATFARCTADPARVDVTTCQALLRDAYNLNVAVSDAIEACGTAPLDTCSAPFEEKGLPAFAARIAVNSECSRADAAELTRLAPLPADHCITMISDILRDEGITPLNTGGVCDTPDVNCTTLHDVHASLWYRDIIATADTPMMQMRLDMFWNECFDQFPTDESALMDCHIANLADIWADLAMVDD